MNSNQNIIDKSEISLIDKELAMLDAIDKGIITSDNYHKYSNAVSNSKCELGSSMGGVVECQVQVGIGPLSGPLGVFKMFILSKRNEYKECLIQAKKARECRLGIDGNKKDESNYSDSASLTVKIIVSATVLLIATYVGYRIYKSKFKI